MQAGLLRASCTRAVAAAVLLWCAGGACRGAALTPDSPAVQEAVRKAVRFLESDAAKDDRVGAKALVGLVLLKSHVDPKHAKILDAVAAIQKQVAGRQPIKVNLELYSTGLSIIFLATLDSSRYSGEIRCLLDSLEARQKPHGGWGYPDRPTGDTSMTQYGVLSAWEAKQVGYQIPRVPIEAVTNWLLETQDPSGGFGYQGTISLTRGLAKQKEVRHSMTAAGAGSLYICADLLGLVPRREKHDDSLPPALQEVQAPPAPAAAGAKAVVTINLRRLKEAEAGGNRWLAAHYDAHPKEWTYYYLYAWERYQSFRELAEGKSEKEPRWYSDGAHFLLHDQKPDGSWTVKDNVGTVPDTAFAALFLLRSSKKSIEKAYGLQASTSVAGRGLPQDTARVTIADGQVVAQARWTTAEQLLPILEHGAGVDFDAAIEALAQLPPPQAEILAASRPDVLRRLAAGRSVQARLAAVRALGRSGSLDQVPALIYALSDPDPAVVYQAGDGLRRITRSAGPRPLGPPATPVRRSEEIQVLERLVPGRPSGGRVRRLKNCIGHTACAVFSSAHGVCRIHCTGPYAMATRLQPRIRRVAAAAGLVTLAILGSWLAWRHWAGGRQSLRPSAVAQTPAVLTIESATPIEPDAALRGVPAADTLAAAADAAWRAAALDDPQQRATARPERRWGDLRLAAEGAAALAGRHWEVQFPTGTTREKYARQLDLFGIELAVVMPNNQLVYVRDVAKAKPVTRTGPASREQRFYLTWREGELAKTDSDLVARAGIAAGDRPVLMMIPTELEGKLAELEKQAAGSRPEPVRKTLFGIRPEGNGYAFYVIEQFR